MDSSFRAIVDQCLTGIIVQRDGKIAYINRAAMDCLGYPAKPPLHGGTLAALFEPESYATLASTFRKLAPEDDQLFMGELKLRRSSGELIDAEVHHVGISFEGSDGTMISFRDVTLNKRMEVELRQAQKLESIGRLAAGMAHEINTPTQYVSDNVTFLQRSFEQLSAIVHASLEVLASARTGDVSKSALEELEGAAKRAKLDFVLPQVPLALGQSLEGLERIATIVGAMKEFSHPSRGEKEPTDLAHTLEATLAVAHGEWKYVAEVEKSFAPNLVVPAMRGDIGQALLNLIVNAAHAIGEVTDDGAKGKGTIRIATRREGPWCVVSIEDTGAGIPDAIRDRIFDPFFTTKTVGKGTGQGLAIVYNVIVEKHGGRIDVTSKVGKGTTFEVRIPLEPAVEGFAVAAPERS